MSEQLNGERRRRGWCISAVLRPRHGEQRWELAMQEAAELAIKESYR